MTSAAAAAASSAAARKGDFGISRPVWPIVQLDCGLSRTSIIVWRMRRCNQRRNPTGCEPRLLQVLLQLGELLDYERCILRSRRETGALSSYLGLDTRKESLELRLIPDGLEPGIEVSVVLPPEVVCPDRRVLAQPIERLRHLAA